MIMPKKSWALDALGDGVKQVYPGELGTMKKLCRVADLLAEDPQLVPVL